MSKLAKNRATAVTQKSKDIEADQAQQASLPACLLA